MSNCLLTMFYSPEKNKGRIWEKKSIMMSGHVLLFRLNLGKRV